MNKYVKEFVVEPCKAIHAVFPKTSFVRVPAFYALASLALIVLLVKFLSHNLFNIMLMSVMAVVLVITRPLSEWKDTMYNYWQYLNNV